MPTPPAPTKWMRRSRRNLTRPPSRSRRGGRPDAPPPPASPGNARRSPIPASRSGLRDEAADRLGQGRAREKFLFEDDGRSRVRERPRVLELVPVGRGGERHQDRRPARRGELGQGHRAGSADGEVAPGHLFVEPRQKRLEPPARRQRPVGLPHRVEPAVARLVETSRRSPREIRRGLDHRAVQGGRALAAAEDEQSARTAPAPPRAGAPRRTRGGPGFPSRPPPPRASRGRAPGRRRPGSRTARAAGWRFRGGRSIRARASGCRATSRRGAPGR